MRLGMPHMADEWVRGLPPHHRGLDSNQRIQTRGATLCPIYQLSYPCDVVIRFVNHSGH